MHYFYTPELSNNIVTLSPEESEHCVKVMRHRNGDVVCITDGKGQLFEAEIVDDNHKKCTVSLLHNIDANCPIHNGLHLAIAPTKNVSRMEWLLEKAIEIGIFKITFLNCEHSERSHINLDRMHRIAVAALKQSQTTWLPDIEISDFQIFINKYREYEADKLIAWCDKDNNTQLTDFNRKNTTMILLIGPEGDFSAEEIEAARREGYLEVKLGNRRLRTETAGLYGCFAASATTK